MATFKAEGRVDAQPLNDDWTSDAISLHGRGICGIHIEISNTDLVGTLYIEASNNGTDWVAISWTSPDPNDSTQSILNASQSIESGTDVSLLIAADVLPFKELRVRYARTSGDTGTISMWTRRLSL